MSVNCDNCKYHDIYYVFDDEVEEEVQEKNCLRNHKQELMSDCECPYFEEYKPKPYIERNTECDKCKFLKKCINEGKVVNATMLADKRQHHVRNIGVTCPRRIYEQALIDGVIKND